MSSIYKTNFEQIKSAYKLIIDALERAFKRFEVDFYLIGAQSRDVWTNHLSITKRTTRDIDYCVYMPDYETWQNLTAYLVNEEGFTRDENEPYRFYKEGIVDLIPFGGIEQNGEVILDNPKTELSVYGCREVTNEAVVIDGNFKVVTLPGLCIMKLIAFDEKPDRRAKDLDDFLLILANYGDIAGDQLFEVANEDLIDGDFQMNIAAAIMLGRHMAVILRSNSELKARVINILTSRLKGFKAGDIDQMYVVRDPEDNQVERFKLISQVLQGIDD
jgi:predicted nucleotidyltransferase